MRRSDKNGCPRRQAKVAITLRREEQRRGNGQTKALGHPESKHPIGQFFTAIFSIEPLDQAGSGHCRSTLSCYVTTERDDYFLRASAPEWLERIRVKRGSRFEHHFWQPGRGHDRNIYRGKTLLAMIDYTHMNPVRKELVEQARDWKWSSAGWFEDRPLNELKPDPIPCDWLEDTGN